MIYIVLYIYIAEFICSPELVTNNFRHLNFPQSVTLYIMNFRQLALLALFSLTSIVEASPDELQIDVTKRISESECTRKTKKGDQIKVHYKGSLENGEVFDSSFTRDQPIQFRVGTGQVIKGWDQGLLDMCIGEERTLIIPSELGYGKRGAGGVIPPDSTLIFETQLVDIVNKDEF